jgi:hypothetical protein
MRGESPLAGCIYLPFSTKCSWKIIFRSLRKTASGNPVVTVNGNPKAANNLPFSDWFDRASVVTYAHASPVNTADPAKRYALTYARTA